MPFAESSCRVSKMISLSLQRSLFLVQRKLTNYKWQTKKHNKKLTMQADPDMPTFVSSPTSQPFAYEISREWGHHEAMRAPGAKNTHWALQATSLQFHPLSSQPQLEGWVDSWHMQHSPPIIMYYFLVWLFPLSSPNFSWDKGGWSTKNCKFG